MSIIFMGDYLPLPNRVMHRKPAEAASLGHTEWTSKGESCICFSFNALLRPLTRCLTFFKRSWRGCSVVALFGRNIAIIVEESQTNVVFVNPVSRNSSSSWKKMHLAGFNLMPCSCRLPKSSAKIAKCASWNLPNGMPRTLPLAEDDP